MDPRFPQITLPASYASLRVWQEELDRSCNQELQRYYRKQKPMHKMTLENPPDGYEASACLRVPLVGEKYISSRTVDVQTSDGTVKRACVVLKPTPPKEKTLLERLGAKVGDVFVRNYGDAKHYALLESNRRTWMAVVSSNEDRHWLALELESTSLISTPHYWRKVPRVSPEVIGAFGLNGRLNLTPNELAQVRAQERCKKALKENHEQMKAAKAHLATLVSQRRTLEGLADCECG